MIRRPVLVRLAGFERVVGAQQAAGVGVGERGCERVDVEVGDRAVAMQVPVRTIGQLAVAARADPAGG